MNSFQILALCGMASPIIYTAAWIIGGLVREEYNHVRDDISSLYAVNAPYQRFFQSLFIRNSVLLFLFNLSLHVGINNGQGSIIGPLLLTISSLMGIIQGKCSWLLPMIMISGI